MSSLSCSNAIGWCLLWLMVGLTPDVGAATYDNSTKASSAVADIFLETPSFAVGGTNRYLLVFVGSGAGTPVAPSSVKWGGSGGTTMTQKGSTLNVGANGKWSCYELIAPTAQTSTVYVTWGSAQDERWILAISFTGVDQTTPTRTMATATGTGGVPNFTMTVNATSVSGDLVVDGAAFLNGGADSATLATNGSQTSRQEVEGAALVYEGAGESTLTASGSSTTMAWTVSGTSSASQDWGTFAMALINAEGASCGYLVTNVATDQVVTESGDAFTNEMGACDDFPLPFKGGRGRMRGR